MEATVQHIPMGVTGYLIIAACILIPFIINTLIEMFMENEAAKTAVLTVFLIPGIGAVVCLLPIPSNTLLRIAFFTSIVLYIIAVIVTGQFLSNRFLHSNEESIDEDDDLLDDLEDLNDLRNKIESFDEENSTEKNKPLDNALPLPPTLRRCLCCGATLTDAKCSDCRFDHTKVPVLHLLMKMDSFD